MYNVERAPARSPISCIIYSQRRIYIQIVSPETQPDLLPVECAACCMRAIVEKFALNSFPRCSHTELFEHEFSERNLIVPVGCASPGPFPRRLRRFQQQNKQSGSLKLAVFTERRWETRVRGNLARQQKKSWFSLICIAVWETGPENVVQLSFGAFLQNVPKPPLMLYKNCSLEMVKWTSRKRFVQKLHYWGLNYFFIAFSAGHLKLT